VSGKKNFSGGKLNFYFFRFARLRDCPCCGCGTRGSSWCWARRETISGKTEFSSLLAFCEENVQRKMVQGS